MSSHPVMTLTPIVGTFPFTTKQIALPPGTKVILGSTEVTATRQSVRIPTATNGWFPPESTEDTSIPSVTPLPLSPSHAQVWSDGGKVHIRDLDSAFGTFVNGTRISKDALLKTGDTIRLGTRIPRNEKTPAYITDFHLVPVVAKVSLTGASS
ncbi:hypothetical protein B0H34DRAFT_657551 [Crassisporium funariophilum]|nr:hypothetical protein B0H34DRAFT_657551 [Crassisporium funariophilum]